MSRAGSGAILLAVIVLLAAGPCADRAAAAGLNEGGVAFLSWSGTDSMPALTLPAPNDTATLYVRLGLVHEVKGFELLLRWTSVQSPPCYAVSAVRLSPGASDCTWIPRGTGAPSVYLGPDSLFTFTAYNTFSQCTSGIIAAVNFDFSSCSPSDSGSFCLSLVKVVDGSSKEDTLTVIGDARIGGGISERPCGPLPPPRVDRIVESSAFYGEKPLVTVSGFNFQPVPTVRLERTGYPPVPAESLTYVNASQLLARFDLTNVDFGTWKLIVENPDGLVELSPPDFVIRVPGASIESFAPRVLYAGPSPGRQTRVTVHGQNFYANPNPPAVRLTNGYNVLTGSGTTLVSTTELSTTFTVPDNLPPVSSPVQDEHAFTLMVQNLNSPQAEYARAIYLYRPPPSIVDVKVTQVADSNFVEWTLSEATSGSRFTILRDSYKCGVPQPNEERQILDSLFIRGTKFHYMDTRPLIGRSHVYTVGHTYLQGLADTTLPSVTSPDTIGVRCPAAAGIVFLGSPVRPPAAPMRILFTLGRPGPVRADVLDLAGRRVRLLTGNGAEVRLTWDGRRADGTRAAAGVYLVAVEAEGRSERRKVLVLP